MSLMHKTMRKILRVVADRDPDYFDMYADGNEACFARLYVERIKQRAAAAGITPPATLLEAGCQAGRLVVPLARMGFQVTGIDTSGFALRRAREHVKMARLDARLIQGDVVKVLRRHPQQYDIVVCAEVVYLSPHYHLILQTLANAVRPGGLLCVSHRPKWYYLLEALRQQDWRTATTVLRTSEGPFRDSAYYNWQTEAELYRLYQALGFQEAALYPIDRLAWLTGLNLARLTAEQRDRWLQCELQAVNQHPSWARYVLVIAQRRRGE